MNPFDEIQRAVTQARLTKRAVEETSSSMAELLVGNLRNANGYFGTEALKKLKRELQQFNANTGKWKEEA
jgi:hypothetical protein